MESTDDSSAEARPQIQVPTTSTSSTQTISPSSLGVSEDLAIPSTSSTRPRRVSTITRRALYDPRLYYEVKEKALYWDPDQKKTYSIQTFPGRYANPIENTIQYMHFDSTSKSGSHNVDNPWIIPNIDNYDPTLLKEEYMVEWLKKLPPNVRVLEDDGSFRECLVVRENLAKRGKRVS